MSSVIFPSAPAKPSAQRLAIMESYRRDETACMETLLASLQYSEEQLHAIAGLAEKLVISVRGQRLGKGGMDSFLYAYDLSSEEGIALLCLAEAALRIPDTANIDQLISEKIVAADWESQRDKSDSFFINATTWGLMLTGKILDKEQESNSYLGRVLKTLLQRSSQPFIRKAVYEAVRILGGQFVMGRSIEEALKNSQRYEKQGYRFSFDMLGEAARTAEDAERYFQRYQQAIEKIAAVERGKGIYLGAGISVKLSALHPRFEFAQQERAVADLTERLRALALQAKAADMGLTVDAEEADRLDLTLDIFAAVLADPALKEWDGLGIAVQAYQKRAFYVIDWLAALARRRHCRIMLRLVKGAYWDYEIKDSQIKGLDGYPVFTRKTHTDVSYLACAQKIINHGKVFFPQFATHNAYTVAAVLTMMGERRDFEFQCLKGMGEVLYDLLTPADRKQLPCRVYAPVGPHHELLPYLVRRLLENGANSSFVNRIVDAQTPVTELTAHPMYKVQLATPTAHPKIPLPANLYQPERVNSAGIDLSNYLQLAQLGDAMNQALTNRWHAASLPASSVTTEENSSHDVHDPSDHQRVIGTVCEATEADLANALTQATAAFPQWRDTPLEQRAACLDRLAELISANYAEFIALAVREAGKTIPDALGEVRETVDYCRYYAALARQTLAPRNLVGPTGEVNCYEQHGRGVFLCISPWNFPLAIFAGQVLAALVAGNCVLAKPALQTPLIAAKVVQLMYQAGIPQQVLQFLPGKGSTIGAAAVADERVCGVMMTGSTETARSINQTLANRKGPIVPLIAETGGQNAMIVDSTALVEQVVADVVTSAFNSAGQRCSALRVLFLQEECADRIITMLRGAMAELRMGDPIWLSTDIGPVIDAKAKAGLEQHVVRMNREAKLIYEVLLPKGTQYGTFFAPRAYEIPSLDLLQGEVFGPVLHVLRYARDDLDKVVAAINATGFGLTLGVHSRINATIDYVQRHARVGNVYVNRNMIGAVVGVQPFGGEGLSGTGPKAGGPNYLTRLVHERSLSVNTTASGGNAALMAMEE